MKDIFVNLKRFDVPRSLGGVCQKDDPRAWIMWIIDECVALGLGEMDGAKLSFLLPEALILTALERLSAYPKEKARSIAVGVQGVYRQDIAPGGNFGAFTTLTPAKAAKNLGANLAIIAHSEERRDKLAVIAAYAGESIDDRKAKKCVDELVNQEVLRALENDLEVLFCIGESAEEKGEGDSQAQKANTLSVLKSQIETGLAGIQDYPQAKITIGYEPIWAIGPGKTPPDADYIGFVSQFIKQMTAELFGRELPVVYGGGLKEDNAAMIASVPTIDGGLVALTRFAGEIGFYPDELRRIIDKYIASV